MLVLPHYFQGSVADYQESVSLAKEAWKEWATVRVSLIIDHYVMNTLIIGVKLVVIHDYGWQHVNLRSPNDERLHNKQIDLLSYVYLSKDIKYFLSSQIFTVLPP